MEMVISNRVLGLGLRWVHVTPEAPSPWLGICTLRVGLYGCHSVIALGAFTGLGMFQIDWCISWTTSYTASYSFSV